MKSVDSMNNTELNDYIDTLERTKTNKSKELIKINKEFREIDESLQKALAERNNRNIDKRYKQLNL
ncbi:Uncharacterised protein [Sebaldella termitidis]|uniref:Uncharacterized protein n=1 Tax=Sebaldella termitidis (strain ATCC 33386 / NCTC 11300) TaxID=526218 RepID=D1AH83_SEBTE|nr:hypothetical protein [Sebaldella termitidis]ACZ08117.1 hypothetical protein Sterm_1250 [Sebaldella termitidis ATCC 33386]SUI23419.1 Uncharacterised protein [Sebaldella termitidis]